VSSLSRPFLGRTFGLGETAPLLVSVRRFDPAWGHILAASQGMDHMSTIDPPRRDELFGGVGVPETEPATSRTDLERELMSVWGVDRQTAESRAAKYSTGQLQTIVDDYWT